MKYRIAYHIGHEINIKTKVSAGYLSLDDNHITFEGKENFKVSGKDIKHMEMFRIHGLGRMIKLVTGEKTIFLTVTHINVLGYFLIINFLKTGKLFKQLEEMRKAL